MHYLNRVVIIGRLAENPKIITTENSGRLAILKLSDHADEARTYKQLHVLVEPPLMVEYAESCLCEGRLVFVEGRLEQITGDFERCNNNWQYTWVVVSKTYGLIHPIGSHSHTLRQPED